MNKAIFAIFAHPDDESFGPSGTLLMESLAGTTVNLITLTAGENGTNPDNLPNLSEVRLNEWKEAGRLIGASKMHHFGFADGALNNTDMQVVAGMIEKLVRAEYENMTPDTEIEFMTSDLNGVTGHIDHIVAARAACLAFYRLKESGLPMTRIRLACLSRELLPDRNTDWIYIEAGKTPEQIDETIDASEHYETIKQIMRAHHTQRDDGERHIAKRGRLISINNFVVLK